MALKPQDPMALEALGMIYAQTHAHESAVTAFRQAVSFAPTSTSCRSNLATALTAMGDIDGAECELETRLKLNVTSWHSHLLLAQRRRQTAERNHLPRLQSLLARHRHNTAVATCLNPAMAKEFEDLGKDPEGFRHTRQGKVSARSVRPYSSQRDTDIFGALMRAFPKIHPEASSGASSDPPI